MIARLFRQACGVMARPGVKTGAVLGVAGFVVAGAIIGALVFVSGVVPIKASSRHWPVTEWILQTGKSRSVATHSLGIDAPSLEARHLVVKGAAQYEIACRACHGGPDLRQPRIAHKMTPNPPYLADRIHKWDDRELFYIVKHGIKFTGMPAWPAQQRDDEVWAMVAFLRKLPELDEAAYERLAKGEPERGAPMELLEGADQATRTALLSCARCHGSDGIARGDGAFPHLAGQNFEYLRNALRAYAAGERHSGIMEPIAAGLDAETIAKLSHYYASLPAAEPPSPDQETAVAIERGSAIAHGGIPAQRVPSCVECHTMSGQRHQSAYPLLAAQPADYLALQLELLNKHKRGGSEFVHLMHAVAPRMKPEQMRDVALYLESLAPTRSPP